MISPSSLFDPQAPAFQARAGLPEEVTAAVALELVSLGGLDSTRRLLDVGAGTGDIGLAVLQKGAGYVGLDASPPMLAAFAARARAAGQRASLVVSDAGTAWPFEPASFAAVFGSRSLHWFDPGHLVAEWLRVGAQGAPLLVGRVVRDPEGPRERIRHHMRGLLHAAGYEGRSGRRAARALLEACAARGATPIEPRTVARWTLFRPPRAALDDWASKPGLGGAVVPEAAKAEILAETARFTASTFGNIDEPLPNLEHYSIEGAFPPPAPHSPR